MQKKTNTHNKQTTQTQSCKEATNTTQTETTNQHTTITNKHNNKKAIIDTNGKRVYNVEHKTTNKRNSYETTQATRNNKRTKQQTNPSMRRTKHTKQTRTNKHKQSQQHQHARREGGQTLKTCFTNADQANKQNKTELFFKETTQERT